MLQIIALFQKTKRQLWNQRLPRIQKFSRYINVGWYMHFWNGNDVIAVFKDKVFEFKHDQKETWKDACDYGRSMGIPEKQLDFLIE